MTELADLIDQYKRAVVGLGNFDALYPEAAANDDIVLGALADGFGEAQLHGFFGSFALDLGAFEVTPDLSPAGRALVVTFASIAAMRTQLINLKGKVRYQAGPVAYESETSASVLSGLLNEAQKRLAYLLALGQRQNFVRDAIFDRYVQVEAHETMLAFGLTELP